jgi:hypothetical protein
MVVLLVFSDLHYHLNQVRKGVASGMFKYQQMIMIEHAVMCECDGKQSCYMYKCASSSIVRPEKLASASPLFRSRRGAIPLVHIDSIVHSLLSTMLYEATG